MPQKTPTTGGDLSDPSASHVPRYVTPVILLVLAFLCLGLYAGALPNDFIFDDVPVIKHDQRVTQGQYARLLTEEYWTEGHKDLLYRPLVSLSYALNWAVCPKPWAFRLFNLALHITVSGLLFCLTRKVIGRLLPAIVAAVIFAIHPIHTEPLNTIIGRADLACTALMLGAALLWWKDADPDCDHSRGFLRPIAAALCFAAANFCKESGLTAVGIALLLDWWRWQRGDERLTRQWWQRRALRCYVPATLVVVAYLLIRLAVLDQLTSGDVVGRLENPITTPETIVIPGETLDEKSTLILLGPEDSKFLVRWGTPLVSLAKGASMMLWPAPLVHDYSYAAFRELRQASDPRFGLALGCIAVLLVVCIVSYRGKREVLLAIALALIPYSIISNFVVIIGTVFGERLLYMPSVGACMALGLLAADAFVRMRALFRNKDRRGLWWALPVCVLSVVGGIWYCGLTTARNRDWRSAETLVLSVPDNEHASFKVLTAYADKALLERDDAKALEYANRARNVAPEAWGPYVPMGVAQMRLGLNDQALLTFTRALRMGAGAEPRALLGASELLIEKGRYEDPIEMLKLLVRLRPDHWHGHNQLAMALIKAPPGLRDFNLALVHARQAVQLVPQMGVIQDTLVLVLLKLERHREAVRAAENALRIIPADDQFRPQLTAVVEKYRDQP